VTTWRARRTAKLQSEKGSLTTGIISAVLIAVIPAVFAYGVNFIDCQRKNDLAYVNSQIAKLYGPLYALTQADDAAWNQFSKIYWPNKSRYFFDPSQPPTVEQVDKWRLWMRTVFQPMNLEIEKTIVNNSQLILGSRMPKTFKEMIAQTEGYKAVIAAWKDSDKNDPSAYISRFNNTVTGLNYPNKILDCVSHDYNELKKRQQLLQRHFFSDIELLPVVSADECDESSQ
jgi:hypothetical protein